MDLPTLKEKLNWALENKKLNQTAHDEIVRWLTQAEYGEYLPQLTDRIENDQWDTLMDEFYRMVIFGTGGIRGIMNIGTNRINNHTVRLASQAFAQYLKKYKSGIISRGVAIAYDCRVHSPEFAHNAACVLAGNDIPVYLFQGFRATPELSFTVRHLNLAGGLVLTASHVPPQYNGYKVYDEFGVQVYPTIGQLIEKEYLSSPQINIISFEEAIARGTIKYLGKDIDEAFAESAKKISVYPGRDVKIVYSPLNGVGSQSVLPVLKALGFHDIELVPGQVEFEGTFQDVDGHFPNPEFPEVYKTPIKFAREVGGDLVMVTDPDADRLGIAAPDAGGNWTPLGGNPTAALLGYFYIKTLQTSGRLPANGVVIKTSVTTELVRDIAESYGLEVIGDLLVGFKFIGDRLENLKKDKTFIYGAEESVGYLFSGDYRDKGAETPAIVASEMAAWCKKEKISIAQLLDSIYEQFGYYSNRVYFEDITGFGSFDQMNLAMKQLRGNLPREINGEKVLTVLDRLDGQLFDGQTGQLVEDRDWDRGDMVTFYLTEDERTAVNVRPSGTEPKIKVYTQVKGYLDKHTKLEIDTRAAALEKYMVEVFDKILKSIKVNVF